MITTWEGAPLGAVGAVVDVGGGSATSGTVSGGGGITAIGGGTLRPLPPDAPAVWATTATTAMTATSAAAAMYSGARRRSGRLGGDSTSFEADETDPAVA